jgi:hypothetical protein
MNKSGGGGRRCVASAKGSVRSTSGATHLQQGCCCRQRAEGVGQEAAEQGPVLGAALGSQAALERGAHARVGVLRWLRAAAAVWGRASERVTPCRVQG